MFINDYAIDKIHIYPTKACHGYYSMFFCDNIFQYQHLFATNIQLFKIFHETQCLIISLPKVRRLVEDQTGGRVPLTPSKWTDPVFLIKTIMFDNKLVLFYISFFSTQFEKTVVKTMNF